MGYVSPNYKVYTSIDDTSPVKVTSQTFPCAVKCSLNTVVSGISVLF